jgi:hypothetical protein
MANARVTKVETRHGEVEVPSKVARDFIEMINRFELEVDRAYNELNDAALRGGTRPDSAARKAFFEKAKKHAVDTVVSSIEAKRK